MIKTYSANSFFDLRVDLSSSINESNIATLNPLEVLQFIVLEYFKYLENTFGKTESKINRDRELKIIISKFYGIESRAYSKEEISLLIDKGSERVRQLINNFSSVLREIINDENSELKISDITREKILEFYKMVQEKRIISITNLKKSLLPHLGISENEYLSLFFNIFDFTERSPLAHHLRNNTFLFTDVSIQIDTFFEICLLVYIFLEKNIVALEMEDIIIDVRRKKVEAKRDLIELATTQLEEIQKVNINGKELYQIRFDSLSNARDMIYRLLSDKGEFMKLAMILKEINHILITNNSTKKITTSVATQLTGDGRFVSQGRTGYWGLREWQGSNETLFELINNTLLHFNKPLSKKEIFGYIVKSRPKIPIKSLDTILYDKTRYTKLENGSFILNDWRDIYKSQIIETKRRSNYLKENPIKEQIKNQAIQLIQQNGDKNLYLNTVVNALNKKFGYKAAAIYAIIDRNEDFVKRIDENGKKMITLTRNTPAEFKTTSVFISYSWENKTHQEKVISFVELLRKEGFNADLDIRMMQEETATDFNKLMHTGIKNYDKVIVILSSTYKTKSESFIGGVGKEYRYILNNIEKEPRKFILASFLPVNEKNIDLICPLGFAGREILDLPKDEASKFQYLFSKLIDMKQYKFSEVASNTPLVESIAIKPFTLSDY